jgi:hypothetical protein
LAAAASRKDHSHLEKWLTEKLILYNDSFLEVICKIYALIYYILLMHFCRFCTCCGVSNLLGIVQYLTPLFLDVDLVCVQSMF